jgi:hypothetical protein
MWFVCRGSRVWRSEKQGNRQTGEGQVEKATAAAENDDEREKRREKRSVCYDCGLKSDRQRKLSRSRRRRRRRRQKEQEQNEEQEETQKVKHAYVFVTSAFHALIAAVGLESDINGDANIVAPNISLYIGMRCV